MRRCRPLAIAAGILALSLTACGTKEKPVYEEKPVELLYNSGLDFLNNADYSKAAREFEEVERQHPFSIWAPRAQIMGAFAHFEADNYDDAVINIDRFIQLHPNHADAPYAYYLKAISYYEQIVDIERDQAITSKALVALDDVHRRYPDSVYARDALLKRDLAFDHLAGKDMDIGRFYLRNGKPVAAINRFRSVLAQYQTTSHTPEALHRLVEAYTALGLTDEAKKTAAVLGYNFPGSAWYSDTYYLITGERVKVKAEYDDSDWIERSWNYLLVPTHSAGVVNLDAEPIRKRDVLKPLEDSGPTKSTLGTPPTGGEDVPEAPAVAAAPGVSAPATASLPAVNSAPAVSSAPTSAAPNTGENLLRVQAQLASAESQAETASEAAVGWQAAADAAVDGSAKTRALGNVAIAEQAASYWQARANLLRLAANDPDNLQAKRAGERGLAKSALEYWRTVERYGESETERTLAAQNAAEAEQALAYWDKQGRGWLGRLFGGSS